MFTWYFNDEPIKQGRAGWEEIDIHDSRKMSTLILRSVCLYTSERISSVMMRKTADLSLN